MFFFSHSFVGFLPCISSVLCILCVALFQITAFKFFHNQKIRRLERQYHHCLEDQTQSIRPRYQYTGISRTQREGNPVGFQSSKGLDTNAVRIALAYRKPVIERIRGSFR